MAPNVKEIQVGNIKLYEHETLQEVSLQEQKLQMESLNSLKDHSPPNIDASYKPRC